MSEHGSVTFTGELSGRELAGDVFVQCGLTGADLWETTTRNCRFDRCRFVNADPTTLKSCAPMHMKVELRVSGRVRGSERTPRRASPR